MEGSYIRRCSCDHRIPRRADFFFEKRRYLNRVGPFGYVVRSLRSAFAELGFVAAPRTVISDMVIACSRRRPNHRVIGNSFSEIHFGVIW
jgi:hypothetical protein